jgi:hypothetical protein
MGEAPTHIITIPTAGPQNGVLTVPLSADNNMVKVRDGAGGLQIIDSDPHRYGEKSSPRTLAHLWHW